MNVIPQETIFRCVKVMAIAVALYLGLRVLGFQTLFVSDADGIGVLLQIIGTLYSVLYAFATYVIWGQFTSVEDQILKESGALKDLLLFSDHLKPAAREPIVRAVKRYAREVVDAEWPALSRRESTERSNRLFYEIVSSVTDAKADDETELALYQRLLEIVNQASTHRDERLSLSIKRIPRTLLVFVTLTAVTILVLLYFYPFRYAPLGLISIAITTMLLFFAYFVLTDLDNPFEGSWNVNADPFEELITKFH